MNSTGDRQLRMLSFTRHILIICLFLLVLVLIGGTVYGLFIHTGTISDKQNKQIIVSERSEEGQTFTSIGRLRVPTVDTKPEMVILFVSFVYYPDDKTFSEELVLRVREFRTIIINYIGSFSATELHELGEDTIKIELLQRFNAILRLGEIKTLYLSDFMIIG